MYRFTVKRLLRRSYQRLSRGEYEPVVKQFGPSSRFVFSGTHALGGERIGAGQVSEWFQRLFRLFPGLRLEPQTVVVNGWPWNTVVATHFTVRATLSDGRLYSNEGMQFLRLRWGRVVEDYLYEDTQKLAAELERMAERGVSEAELGHEPAHRLEDVLIAGAAVEARADGGTGA
jgi:ketosteroid isomerase-like protein